MADAPLSYAIVIGVGIFLAGVLFGSRAKRLSHIRDESLTRNIGHSEAA